MRCLGDAAFLACIT